jgi:ABC-type glycerol-3-phosphate transport system substrate-binding protein
MRGFAGAGQNMYIYPSIFRGFGGQWFKGKQLVVDSPEAVRALEWYVDALTKYAPPAVRNWNWPDIADAFSQGTVACYLDAHSSAAVITNPEKSKVVGKVAYARWPAGPGGKRVTSIWNWGFPVNAALSDKAKRATWLFITWAASAETQARTSWKFAGPAKRSGLNRMSLWRAPEFAQAMQGAGDNFINAALQSLEHDTDVDWRPRVPQWPAVGEAMATSIQAALVGQKKPKEALDEAQQRIQQVMKA